MTKSPRTLHSLVWAKGGGGEEVGTTHELVVLFSLCGPLGGLLVTFVGLATARVCWDETFVGLLLCTFACMFLPGNVDVCV